MTSAVANTEANSKTVSVIEQKADLEQRYIGLLEKRIAQLEKQLAPASSPEETPAVSTASTATEPASQASVGAEKKVTGSGASEAPDNKSNGEKQVAKEEGAGASSSENPENKDAKKSEDDPRVKNVIQRWNADKYDYETLESSATAAASPKFKTLTTFRKVMDRDNERKLYNEEIDIESPELMQLFLECSLHRENARHKHGDMIALVFPFVEFVWCWDKFAKAQEPQPDDTDERKKARQDLTQLLSMVQKASLEPYFRIRETLQSAGTIRYEWLWTLFPRGELVYTRSLSPVFTDWQMLEVYSCHLPSTASDETSMKTKSFSVSCMAFDFNGTKFERYVYEFNIKKFEDEKPIHKLEIFPTRYYRAADDESPNDANLQRDLLKRGKRFVNFCTADVRDFQCDYDGTAISATAGGVDRLASARLQSETASVISDDREDDGTGISSIYPEVQGQVIIDPYLFMRSERNRVKYGSVPLGDVGLPFTLPETTCACQVCRESPTLQWEGSTMQDLRSRGEDFSAAEQRLKMCPPKVLGYALRQKIWGQFRINSLRRREDRKEVDRSTYFEQDLQLDQKYKQILLAFIQNHEAKSNQIGKHLVKNEDPQTFDIIKHKGKGLAILLHGAPGVGKTLTAETIALATGRPLVVVSVAEVGTKASDAERNLSAIFGDAARWGAILLMDEADVFLEAREKTENPDRNALVSVMLRCLEYYEGIIILTTNRIRSFDVAVQSRMHLAIQYDDLTPEAKANIYRTLLKKVPSDQLDPELKSARSLERKLDQLCRRGKINGRQIRNVVGSAYALAKSSEEGILKFEHLEEVHEMTMDFVSSLMEDTRGTRQINEAGRR